MPDKCQGLNVSTRHRLERQLDRALNRTVGAEQGLLVLVNLATRQMFAEGAERTAVRNAIAEVATSHAPDPLSKSSPATDRLRVATLKALMLQWSDRVDRQAGSVS